MSWEMMVTNFALQNNPYALNAKAEQAYASAFNETSTRMAQGWNAENNVRLAEKNMVRIGMDKQAELTRAATARAEADADIAVQAAAAGITGTYRDVATQSVRHSNARAVEDINNEYGSRMQQTSMQLQSSLYDFYAVTGNHKPKYKKFNPLGLF